MEWCRRRGEAAGVARRWSVEWSA
uniref:Uncharacterized protein n=1 Tax=Arundo donax TaxID=35708 RepID=A0A0A8YRN3_ARUDO